MIKKRGKGWLIKIYLGRDKNGKEKYYTETFYAPLKSMAQERERSLKQKFSKLRPNKGVNTLGEWLDRWLEGKKETVSDVTYRWYASHVRTLKPIVGDIRLLEVTGETVRKAIGNALDGLEPRSRRNLLNTLQTALREAVENRLLPQEALLGFKTVRVPRKHRPVLSKDDILQLLPLVMKYKHGLVLRLLLVTGARLQEVLGLTWDRIDWKKNAVVIDQAADVQKGKLKHETKTQNSRRTVYLDQETMDLLKIHKQTQKAQTVRSIRREQELVFRSDDGRPLRYNSIRRTWQFVKKKACLPADMRIHDIRHSIITLLLSEGVPPIVVASLAGHNVGTMVTKYAQQIKEGKSLLVLDKIQ